MRLHVGKSLMTTLLLFGIVASTLFATPRAQAQTALTPNSTLEVVEPGDQVEFAWRNTTASDNQIGSQHYDAVIAIMYGAPPLTDEHFLLAATARPDQPTVRTFDYFSFKAPRYLACSQTVMQEDGTHRMSAART